MMMMIRRRLQLQLELQLQQRQQRHNLWLRLAIANWQFASRCRRWETYQLMETTHIDHPLAPPIADAISDDYRQVERVARTAALHALRDTQTHNPQIQHQQQQQPSTGCIEKKCVSYLVALDLGLGLLRTFTS